MWVMRACALSNVTHTCPGAIYNHSTSFNTTLVRYTPTICVTVSDSNLQVTANTIIVQGNVTLGGSLVPVYNVSGVTTTPTTLSGAAALTLFQSEYIKGEWQPIANQQLTIDNTTIKFEHQFEVTSHTVVLHVTWTPLASSSTESEWKLSNWIRHNVLVFLLILFLAAVVAIVIVYLAIDVAENNIKSCLMCGLCASFILACIVGAILFTIWMASNANFGGYA
jgi:hypothetical protein